MSEPQEMGVQIPDSIEVYRGYKALNYNSEGMLFSPSKGTPWPLKKRFEALCTNTEWSWVPIEGEPREMDASVDISSARPIVQFSSAVTVSSAVARPVRFHNQYPRPNNKLPDGWSWSWEMLTHDVPAEDCSCGCYAVDDPQECITYLDHGTGIIVEIAMWGKVIKGATGMRGQYAYPQRILSPRQLVGEIRHVSLVYGIPVLILDPVESTKVCTDPVCSCGDLCRVTGMDRGTPNVIVPNPALVPLAEDPVKKAFEAHLTRLFARKKK